ncbi:hypothetical protein B0E46_04840 [Rhodanobacter sp. B04]|uniref:DUF5329 family protein n=1 Tax=Rhodanobacter sp. B04 TaxID=1945860 RepID=UPI00098429D0|nr:DUF5329 family protein [Rhodanobacter sp. B04]OOG64740.1 hypothetical protein B0E46_04840 [Rhodanobacter sp. B04]
MNRLIATWMLFALLAAPAFGQQDVEQQKIAYLIDAVANLKDATFIRNGIAYDAAHAADHMRLKLRYYGSRVKTAKDFIIYCATGSSMSGIKYSIRFHDGHSIDSATFLRGKLTEYELRTGSDTR